MKHEKTQSWTGPNGVIFKVGDTVTGYRKGVHRILEIERRFYTKNEPDWMRKGRSIGDEYSPLVVLQGVLNSKMRKAKGQSTCDIGFCQHVTADTLRKQLAEITKDYEAAIKLLS